MTSYLVCLAVAVIGGLMMSRLTKKINLPAVTAYLVAGLVLGPFCLGAIGIEGVGFQSLHQVERLGILTQTALGFIAFSMGSEFRLHQIKAMGKKAILIGLCYANGLSPISGKYGFGYGFLAAGLHYLLVSAVPDMHGGFLLYNGGFTAALICLVFVPQLEKFCKTKEERALTK